MRPLNGLCRCPLLASTAVLLVLLQLSCFSASALNYKSWNSIDLSSIQLQHGRGLRDLARRSLAGNSSTSTWKTIDGFPPLVIANGGSSGLFPDQTQPAYLFAKNNSLATDTALLCDLQLTFDGFPVCRTGIDLASSTTVNLTFPTQQNHYVVNGEQLTGFFAIDFNASDIFGKLYATQSNPARSPYYDGHFFIVDPTLVFNFSNGGLVWVNVEYAEFYTQFGISMSTYVVSLLENLPVSYISSPEIVFLKAVKKGAPKSNLVLRFNGKNDIEPSTNVTYGSLLSNLKTIATYASGILVPKDYVWPVDSTTGYLDAQTTLVKDAHSAGLAIYVSGFLNDQNYPIYNYSFDPIREYLQYAPSADSNVDGFLTDFPSTASEALACYRSTPSVKKTGTEPLVISHNGASGDYPGCTLLAYEAAVKDGANYIDCPIQITKDGVAICRESANLLNSTDISTTAFFPSHVSEIPELDGKGLYSFNLTWNEIQTLKARMYTPGLAESQLPRNPAYDGTQQILSLSDFLKYAQNQTTSILIDIQNGYFIETELGLDVIGPVLSALSSAGLNNSDRVIIQSEDSAVLKHLRELTTYTLVYRVKSINVTITATEVKEIKALADRATLPRGLVQPANYGYLLNSTGVVDLFHAQNMSVYVYFLRNVFTALAFDYEADPTLELNTMFNYFKVDGVITDYPATASAYLSNGCLNLKTELGGLDYSLRFVIPGDLVTNVPPSIPPAPAAGARLNVTGNQVALPTVFTGSSSTTSTSPSSSPSAQPSAGCHMPVPYMFIVVAILATAFHSLMH